MIISTTAICERYSVIDTFLVLDQYSPKGMMGMGGFDLDASFEKTKVNIEELARLKGGDAVIGCNFEIRMAVGQMGGQVFEVFCFGTIVKLLE